MGFTVPGMAAARINGHAGVTHAHAAAQAHVHSQAHVGAEDDTFADMLAAATPQAQPGQTQDDKAQAGKASPSSDKTAAAGESAIREKAPQNGVALADTDADADKAVGGSEPEIEDASDNRHAIKKEDGHRNDPAATAVPPQQPQLQALPAMAVSTAQQQQAVPQQTDSSDGETDNPAVPTVPGAAPAAAALAQAAQAGPVPAQPPVAGQKDSAGSQKESKKESGKDPAPQDVDVTTAMAADPKPAKPATAQSPAPGKPANAQLANAELANAQPGDTQLANTQLANTQPGAAPADTARHGNADAIAKDDTRKIDDGGKPADTQPQAPLSQAQPAQVQPAQAPSADASIIAAATPTRQATATTMAAASAPTPMPQHLDVGQQALVPNMAALGVAIATRSLSGSRQFDIRLDPPELGRVDVRLSIDSTGKASAHLSADQQQTLDLLQKDASGLTRALRDAGLNVAQNGLNFSLRQQGGGDRSGFSSRGRQGGHQPLSAIARIGATHTSIPLSVAAFHGAGDGRLDIKV